VKSKVDDATTDYPATDARHRLDLARYATDPHVRIGSALRELRRQTPVLRSVLWNGGAGLEPSQQDALETLVRVYPHGVAIRVLAATLRSDPSSTSRVIDRLRARGLASKESSPEDGRVLLVRATAAGEQFLQSAFWPGRARYAELIERTFDRAEVETLAGLLVRLVNAIDAAGDALGQSSADELDPDADGDRHTMENEER